LEELVKTILEWGDALGYPGIFILMALESSFFPFPSELVMIPAGCLAYTGDMNLFAAIGMGIAGSLAGAFFNYYLAVWLGRPFIIRFGKYFLLPERKLEKAERFFEKHGAVTTFVCRLIPGVRQVISFPAGLARMNLLKFTIYTGAGAGLWVTVLALFGFWVAHNKDNVKEIWHEHKWPIVIGLVVFAAAVLVVYILFKRKTKNSEQEPATHEQ
jgi:membrane protein DedA with SNARE-associated domain